MSIEHKGKVSLRTIEEAIAAIGCEEQGILTKLVRSWNLADEFIEYLRIPLQVKGFSI